MLSEVMLGLHGLILSLHRLWLVHPGELDDLWFVHCCRVVSGREERALCFAKYGAGPRVKSLGSGSLLVSHTSVFFHTF